MNLRGKNENACGARIRLPPFSFLAPLPPCFLFFFLFGGSYLTVRPLSIVSSSKSIGKKYDREFSVFADTLYLSLSLF